MSMTFANQYHATIWTMIEWYSPGCADGGNWEKRGWWQIEPGQSATVFGGDLADVNQIWYFFGHASDGAVWAGQFSESVPPTAFDWCSNTSSTEARTIGMRELTIGQGVDNHTLNFTP